MKFMGKQIIRLTENDLHKIIENSVKKIIKEVKLNEIGNTQQGQYMLGRLSRKRSKGDKSERKVSYDAYKKATRNFMYPSDAFRTGEHHQDLIDNASNSVEKDDAYNNMKDFYNRYKSESLDALGYQFVYFIQRYKGGKLLQNIIDYANSNPTDEQEFPFYKLIKEFEDNVLGYKCTQEMREAIVYVFSDWWAGNSDRFIQNQEF